MGVVGLGQTGAEVTPQVSRAMRGLQTDPEGTGGLAGSAQALCLSPACLEKWGPLVTSGGAQGQDDAGGGRELSW